MVVNGREALFDEVLIFLGLFFCPNPVESLRKMFGILPLPACTGGTQHPAETAREITGLFPMVIIL